MNFPTESEMAMGALIAENRGLTKVSVQFRRPEPRTKIEGSLIRNGEIRPTSPALLSPWEGKADEFRADTAAAGGGADAGGGRQGPQLQERPQGRGEGAREVAQHPPPSREAEDAALIWQKIVVWEDSCTLALV